MKLLFFLAIAAFICVTRAEENTESETTSPIDDSGSDTTVEERSAEDNDDDDGDGDDNMMNMFPMPRMPPMLTMPPTLPMPAMPPMPPMLTPDDIAEMQPEDGSVVSGHSESKSTSVKIVNGKVVEDESKQRVVDNDNGDVTDISTEN